MKKTLLGVAIAMSLIVAGVVFMGGKETPVSAAKPDGTSEKVWGDVTAQAGSATLDLIFEAHGGKNVHGGAEYSNSSSKWFEGDVDVCYKQEGDKVAFGGTVLDGNYPDSKKYFLIEVLDGEDTSVSDRVRVRLFNTKPPCEISGSFPGVVIEGDIKIASMGPKEKACTTIQSEELLASDGSVIEVGYDDWGYNYQARLFNGKYCDAYRDAPWCQVYVDDNLSMKWNDAWLSNKDCDGDGLLDRHFGFGSYIGSGAWLTNHMSGEYEDEGGELCKWNYFVKIVAAPVDAYVDSGSWYLSDGTEIGPVIWGAFAITMEVNNDTCTGDHGSILYGEAPTGFGFY